MQGQGVALLHKLAILNEPQVPSKNLAESMFISPSAVSRALKRCADSGLLYISSEEKRVNRSALMEFLAHGLKYVLPPAKGPLVRGVPTAPRQLRRNRSNRAYWRMVSLPQFGRMQQERFGECRLARSTRMLLTIDREKSHLDLKWRQRYQFKHLIPSTNRFVFLPIHLPKEILLAALSAPRSTYAARASPHYC